MSADTKAPAAFAAATQTVVRLLGGGRPNEVNGGVNVGELFRPGAVDWELIYRVADLHCVLPLLYKKLAADYADLVDPDTLGRFEKRFRETARYNFARATQLIGLVKRLEDADVPVIAYKGAALAVFAYRDNSLRQYTDIDLLIRKEDFSAVRDRLTQLGCRPAWQLTADQEKAVLKYHYEYPFHFGENDILVEVHWDFLESFFAFEPDLDGVWSRAVEIEICGQSVPTLSAEDYLLFLCAHGSKHFWERLSWICDVAKVIENTAPDWDLAVKLAGRTGAGRMLLIGAYLARELLGTQLPEPIERRLAEDPLAVRLGERFRLFLFGRETPPAVWTEAARLHLGMREKTGTKIKYAQRLFSTKLIDKLFMPLGRPR